METPAEHTRKSDENELCRPNYFNPAEEELIRQRLIKKDLKLSKTCALKPVEALSNKLKRNMRRAWETCQVSDCTKHMAAVIVKNGRVLSVGVNHMRNDPMFILTDKSGLSVHAEVSAMRAVSDENLDGAVCFVARTRRDSVPAMSKPCKECENALRTAGIKACYWFSYTGLIGVSKYK